jgi:hypothetical protein
MNIFTILTYTMLALVVVTGLVSLPRELGRRRALKRRFLPVQTRRVLRDRA